MKLTIFVVRVARKLVRGPAEAWLLVRMAGWLTLLSVAVKLLPLPRALSLVSTKTRNRAEASEPETQRRLAAAVDLLLKTDLLIFKPICWKRAALLHRYLALNGIKSQIVFGMRKESDGRLAGHAWLERNGVPILEAAAPNYAVTYCFPSHEAFEVDLSLLGQNEMTGPNAVG